MKLAVFTSSSTGFGLGMNGPKAPAPTFRDFRVLARLQPPAVAARLVRLSRGVEKSIDSSDPKRYVRARWLEESVGYIVQTRPGHEDSQCLQHCLTRLLRQSFQSLDWRRSLIGGLAPARIHGQAGNRPFSSATS